MFSRLSSSCNDGVLYLISLLPYTLSLSDMGKVCLFWLSTIMLVPQMNVSETAKWLGRMWCYVHNLPGSHQGSSGGKSLFFFINISSFNYYQNFFCFPFFHLFPLCLMFPPSTLLFLQWISHIFFPYTIRFLEFSSGFIQISSNPCFWCLSICYDHSQEN